MPHCTLLPTLFPEKRVHISFDRQKRNAASDEGFAQTHTHTHNLREIADDVEAARVLFGHHVEEEGRRIVVKRLMVEEEFRQQAEILCVDLVLAAVDLEEGDGVLSIDFGAGRMIHDTLLLE